MSEEKTIYQKYDDLLKANANLSDENFTMSESIKRLEKVKERLELRCKDAFKAGKKEAIEDCAKIVETQDRDANYQWIDGSFWGSMTKKFAAMIRRIDTTVGR